MRLALLDDVDEERLLHLEVVFGARVLAGVDVGGASEANSPCSRVNIRAA